MTVALLSYSGMCKEVISNKIFSLHIKHSSRQNTFLSFLFSHACFTCLAFEIKTIILQIGQTFCWTCNSKQKYYKMHNIYYCCHNNDNSKHEFFKVHAYLDLEEATMEVFHIID